jgi:hypothetical protein
MKPKVVSVSMGMQPRPGDKMIDGYPYTCSREQSLQDKSERRSIHKQYEECDRINRRPGYEKLTKMKFNR